VVLALCAAALWGTGDFLGGLATRRTSVLIVLFWSQLVGLGGLTAWVLVTSANRPGNGLLYAVGAGIAGVIGLGCLYRGMAVGAMGIVAPISAISPVVPLAVDLLRGRSPAFLQWVGIGLALVGVILVSREPGSIRGSAGIRSPVAAGVGLALIAALGFGLFIVGLGEAAQESAPWAAATARLGAVSVLSCLLSRGGALFLECHRGCCRSSWPSVPSTPGQMLSLRSQRRTGRSGSSRC
jgi:drug/metabolite transporter (DMT)-like permease